MYKHKPKWWLNASSPVACVLTAFGSVSKTARALGVTPGCVSKWRASGKVPDRLHARAMKSGKVSKRMLRLGRA